MPLNVRLRPVPVVEPCAAVRIVPETSGPGPTAAQQVLPFEPVPFEPVPFEAPPFEAPPFEAPPFEPSRFEPPPTALAVPREPAQQGPEGFALRFAQAALEVSAGLRPPAQLQRWTTDGVHATLQHRHAAVLRSGGRPRRARVRSVHVTSPTAGVAEVAAVVGDGVRCRAVAFRMEGSSERWRVTALQLG